MINLLYIFTQKIVFNTLNNSTKLIFRKLGTETRKLTAEKLRQKFIEICLIENLLPTYKNFTLPMRQQEMKNLSVLAGNNLSDGSCPAGGTHSPTRKKMRQPTNITAKRHRYRTEE